MRRLPLFAISLVLASSGAASAFADAAAGKAEGGGSGGGEAAERSFADMFLTADKVLKSWIC